MPGLLSSGEGAGGGRTRIPLLGWRNAMWSSPWIANRGDKAISRVAGYIRVGFAFSIFLEPGMLVACKNLSETGQGLSGRFEAYRYKVKTQW